ALTDIARGLESRSDLMRKRKPQVNLASGSGLTPTSRASARDLAALLGAMYKNTGLFPTFLGSLTVPAYTPVHMLSDPGNRAWMQRIAAKTGSLHGAQNVFALAGYFRLPDDSWGAFAVIVNDTKQYEPSLATSIAATRDALTPYLQVHPANPAIHH
ncbi:MAG: D-alanyl-D-alanine carboxypeptidase, partial [Gammaproteobacteria bacterium]